jgi:hypothetical protein
LLRIWYRGLVISVPDASDQRGGRWSFQHAALKHPRTIAQRMLRFNFASLDGEPECSRIDPEDTSCLLEIHPSLALASISIVTRDVMVGAE